MAQTKLILERKKGGSSKEEHLNINKRKRMIKGSFKIFELKDGDYFVTYIPSLNMTGYGSTFEESYDLLTEILDDYFSKLIDLSPASMSSELEKYGWNKGFFKKQFLNSSFVDKDGVLKNFDMPKDTPIEERLLEVA